MSDIAIRVEGLSKQYKIGVSGRRHDTLRDELTDRVKTFLRRNGQPGSRPDLIWALKDVSFEVKRGEIVGVVGRNGAGKSTLLKILSRVTEPTRGRAEIYGRVGSLLEVGTGFHPELTGRENIYLNGAILGMKKAEIDRKFDEIVAFSGVQKFIDTPVKRYSSGMYVRLAFAVAAHLEPEILIVDEVLAVGDTEFQNKCLWKMSEVAKGGRTVLFVSHNMQAICQLTNRCILITNGSVKCDGPTADVTRTYLLTEVHPGNTPASYEARPKIRHNHVASARVETSDEHGLHRWGERIRFHFVLRVTDPLDGLRFSFQVLNELKQPICHFWLLGAHLPYRYRPGTFSLLCEIPKFRLYLGSYTLRTWLSDRRSNTALEVLSGICPFEVTMQGVHREEYNWSPGACAYLEDAVWAPVKEEGF